MAQPVEELLRARNVHPTNAELATLTARWAGLQAQRGTLEGIELGPADIALRTIPGGDHLER